MSPPKLHLSNGVSLLVAAMLIVAAGPPYQVAAQQQQPTFRTDTDLVRLNVSVLDKERRPVRGLTVADFEIKVGGVVQPIVVAVEESAPAFVRPDAGWVVDRAPDVVGNDVTEPRLFVILIDDVLAYYDAFYIGNARTAALEIIDQLGPNDRAAVVFTWHNSHAQDFTNDRERLRAAVRTFKPGPPLGAFTRQAQTISGRVLRSVMDHLSRHPGLQKGIFWLSPGDARGTRTLDRPVGSWGTSLRDLSEAANPFSSVPGNLLGTRGYQQLSQIPVYGIHPGGLVAHDGLQYGDLFGLTSSRRMSPENVAAENRALDTIARRTGGRAVVDTNDPRPAVRAIFDELSTWYVLGYRPTHALYDGRNRWFQVKVNRPGVKVYPSDRAFVSPKLPEPATATAKGTSVATPTRALSGLFPDAGLPLAVHLAPFYRPAEVNKETPAAIAVSLALPRASVVGTTATQEHLDVEIRVFDGEGLRAYGTEHRQVTWTVDPTQPTQGVDLITTLTLKPGRYAVRIGVHHPGRNETGSVYADLTVPDFAKTPLSASGVALSAAGRTAVPSGALADVLSMVPTTQRTFRASDTVRAYMELYQGGNASPQDVGLRIQMVNTADAVVFSHEQRLVAASFTGQPRMVPVAIDVPLSTLSPGEYLLTFDAATNPKQTVTRHVRVRVE
jgi:VWFA-related protein